MSTTFHCAAIDLGATSGRVIVGAWSKNRLTLTEVHRFPNQFRSVDGHDYWDVPSLWTEVRAGLLKARKQFPKLASVGVDTWGVDHALVDRTGRVVFPVHAYRDDRTQGPLKHLSGDANALERVYDATGIPPVFYNSSFQLAETVATFPAVSDTATRCLLLPDYFNFLLSGRMENELSIASTTQLLDVRGRDWSATALAHFKIPAHWFSTPVRAGTKLGTVRDIPELKGVRVVAVPGHDTACAYAAMPANTDASDLYISSGTWSLVGFESSAPLLGHDALAAKICNERMGDGSYRPLRNVIGLWLLEQILKDFASRPKNDREWAALIKAAEKLPDPAHLLDVSDPAFGNPPSMRAAIDAHLKKRKATPPRDLPGYTRLICESLGLGHADAARTFERMSGKTFKRILVVGGGAKNRLLCQATADAARIPVVAFQIEGTAVGNIAHQLIALGAVKNLATFRPLFGRTLEQTVYSPRSA
jgi:rhamnulokinase